MEGSPSRTAGKGLTRRWKTEKYKEEQLLASLGLGYPRAADALAPPPVTGTPRLSSLCYKSCELALTRWQSITAGEAIDHIS